MLFFRCIRDIGLCIAILCLIVMLFIIACIDEALHHLAHRLGR